MKIESIENTKVKAWMKLKEKKYRDETGLFLIEGDHLLREAEKKGLVKEKISLKETTEENSFWVSIAVMKKLSSQVTPPEIMAVCYKKKEEEYQNNIIILDRIQDPGNLGTIIRSAVAFSYDTIILSEDSVDLYNEKVIRSTEGMIFHCNVLRKDLNLILPTLKKQGFTIYGTNVQTGVEIRKEKFPRKKVVIIGSEGQGMNLSLTKFLDKTLYIPMSCECESLNAGISASIIMYESGKNHE